MSKQKAEENAGNYAFIFKTRLKKAVFGLLNNMKMSLPILFGVLLLVGLFNSAIRLDFLSNFFVGNKILDPIVGAIFGSLASGNPLTSYVIGGELLENGISLIAVCAFILSWVTVGIVQLPAESLMLGKGFALARNGTSFILSIVVAILTVITLEIVC